MDSRPEKSLREYSEESNEKNVEELHESPTFM